MEQGTDIIVWADPLRESCSRLFQAKGVPKQNADLVSETLVESDLRGVHSHGTSRMRSYITFLEEGTVNPQPNMRVVQERTALALLDADDGHGQVAGVKAMRLAMEKAREVGFAAVAVRNSFHYGAAAYYAMMALDEDMIGFATTNTLNNTVIWGSMVGGVGNNPVSYAIPAGEELPIVLDAAHSVVAHGKVRLAQSEGKEIPLGWGVDEEGNPTTDPNALKVMLPAGGYKGSGQAVVMEILSGILPGSRSCFEARQARERGDKWRIGHFFWALDIEGFMPVEHFRRRVDEYIRAAKALPKAAGVERIYMPGEIEYRLKAECLENGIPLARSTVAALQELDEELGVEIDLG